jgi:hypothetical protein
VTGAPALVEQPWADAATGILLDLLRHHHGAADARITPALAA